MEKLRDFVGESKTFNGFEFHGNYTIKRSFLEMYDIFVKDGVNLLDCYSDFKYLSWMNSDDLMNRLKTREECNALDNSLSLLRKYKLVDPDELGEQRTKLSRLRRNYENHLESLRQIPRKNACAFTSKKSTKTAVFELHGNKCLCCGSIENISIDHVIAVKIGGENAIENMQPLCRSCNSKKSTKTTDYRKLLKF